VSYLAGFVIALVVLIVETVVLVQNVEKIKFVSLIDILYDPVKVSVYGAYITSLFAIPALTTWISDASKSIVALYRRYVVMSLESVDESSVRKRVGIALSAVPIASLSILFSVLYRAPHLALVPLAPLAILAAILLKPLLDVSSHGRAIDVELKWFILLLITVEHVKAGIHYLIKKLSRASLLPAIVKELKVIHRDALVYFGTYVESLIQRARVTPSQAFKKILLGYSMRIRSGGDTVSWLKAVLNEELVKEEWVLRNYSERISVIVLQVSTALFILLPTLAIAIPVLNPSTVLFASLLGAPALGLLAYATRPRKLDKIDVRYTAIPLVVLCVATPLLYLAIGAQGAVISWALAAICSFNGYRVLREVRELDEASLELLKVVAELRKHGLEIPRALRFVVQSRALSPCAQRRVRKLIDLLNSGYTFEEALSALKTPSHTFNFVLHYLAMLHECGGGDEEVIQMAYEYLYRFKAHEEILRKTSYIFDLFAVANLFILVWVWRSASRLVSQWLYLSPQPPLATLTASVIGLTVAVSMVSYSLVSSIVRNGLPILETPREVPKALLTLASVALLNTL
jgi:flagellar protein FlaJ